MSQRIKDESSYTLVFFRTNTFVFLAQYTLCIQNQFLINNRLINKMSNNDLNPYISPDEYGGGSAKDLKAQKNNMQDGNYFMNQGGQQYANNDKNTANDLWAQAGNQIVLNSKKNSLENPYYNQPPPPSYQQPPFQRPPFANQPNQGYPPLYPTSPMMQVPMNPPPNYPMTSPNPLIVNIPPANTNICQFCKANASVFHRRKAGCALYTWCFCLFCFTGFCCWIPCVIDECYDQQVICANCQAVKAFFKSRYGC